MSMNDVEIQLQQLLLQLEQFTETVRQQQAQLAELAVGTTAQLSLQQRRAVELQLVALDESSRSLTQQLAPGFSEAMQHRLGLLRNYLYE